MTDDKSRIYLSSSIFSTDFENPTINIMNLYLSVIIYSRDRSKHNTKYQRSTVQSLHKMYFVKGIEA
ncbi:hypothetical protein GCM10025777_28400 [Membranihabitans marinus]